MTELWKASDYLNHDLLIDKLHTCGFDKNALKLVYSYLKERKQRVKIDNEYSEWEETYFVVPQGSIFGPLLFYMFLWDLFFTVKSVDITSYADDTTPYTCCKEIDLILEKIETVLDKILKWFNENAMKINLDKFHLLFSAKKGKSVTIAGEEWRVVQMKNLYVLLLIIS